MALPYEGGLGIPHKPRPGRPPTPRARPVEAPCASEPGGCEIGELFRIFGKAHMLDLVYIFLREDPGQPRRFVELQDRLDMSPNTLSDRLKELVEAGLLTRTAYNEIPPRVDYVATAKALDLEPVFGALKAWSARHNLQPLPTAPSAPAATTGN